MRRTWPASPCGRAVGVSTSGCGDEQTQPCREAWALRAGHVELADVLSGDICVGAHVNDVDATYVVPQLQVLESQGDDFLRDMRLAQPGLIGHEKASRRVPIEIQAPERVLSRRSLEVAQRSCSAVPSLPSHDSSARIARRASRTGSHTPSQPGGRTAFPRGERRRCSTISSR